MSKFTVTFADFQKGMVIGAGITAGATLITFGKNLLTRKKS